MSGDKDRRSHIDNSKCAQFNSGDDTPSVYDPLMLVTAAGVVYAAHPSSRFMSCTGCIASVACATPSFTTVLSCVSFATITCQLLCYFTHCIFLVLVCSGQPDVCLVSAHCIDVS
jgi:hypothetical protein